MTCMDQFTGEDRHASYIVHYAGYPSLEWVLSFIPKDIKKWKEDKGTGYKYKKHLYISVNGGLGDQICAEPAIRFMKENLYPNDEMVVATHWPRLFKHLEKLGITVCEHGKADLGEDNAYFLKSTLPGPETLQWSIVSHLMCHCVDYISMALMKRTLPIKDKQLKLKVELKDVANLMDVVGDQKFDIAIHPGRHWDSKTFPVKYWQEIIDGLVKAGKKVCIIGQDSAGDPPDYVAGARGTVDVECPEGAVDLRNLLDLGSSLALLSMTKVLVSNDSAPIHMAGSFDNWIVLIESCKHSDHVLPYRRGRIDYKTVAMAEKLALDDIESRPTQVSETSAEFIIKDWNEYLPLPSKVISKVVGIINNKE